MKGLHNIAYKNGSENSDDIADKTGGKGMAHFFYSSDAKIQRQHIKYRFTASDHNGRGPADKRIRSAVFHDSLGENK